MNILLPSAFQFGGTIGAYVVAFGIGQLVAMLGHKSKNSSAKNLVAAIVSSILYVYGTEAHASSAWKYATLVVAFTGTLAIKTGIEKVRKGEWEWQKDGNAIFVWIFAIATILILAFITPNALGPNL